MSYDWKHEIEVVEGALVDKVEAKVKAASTAAAVVGFATTLLGSYVFHGTAPSWAVDAIGAAVTGALTFAAGWVARHTPRTTAAPPV